MQSFKYSERYYWRCSTLALLLIFATLFVGNPLQQWWTDQNSHAVVFLVSMLLIGASLFMGGFSYRDRWELWALRLGLTAVFMMFLLRLTASERSHIIEYCILTYCVFKALSTRYRGQRKLGIIHLQSAALCICTAFVDEGLQALLPQRVGSWEDIIFDVGAVGFALGVIAILAWGKKIILN